MGYPREGMRRMGMGWLEGPRGRDEVRRGEGGSPSRIVLITGAVAASQSRQLADHITIALH